MPEKVKILVVHPDNVKRSFIKTVVDKAVKSYEGKVEVEVREKWDGGGDYDIIVGDAVLENVFNDPVLQPRAYIHITDKSYIFFKPVKGYAGQYYINSIIIENWGETVALLFLSARLREVIEVMLKKKGWMEFEGARYFEEEETPVEDWEDDWEEDEYEEYDWEDEDEW